MKKKQALIIHSHSKLSINFKAGWEKKKKKKHKQRGYCAFSNHTIVNQKRHSVGFLQNLLTKYCLPYLVLANLLRASNGLWGNKANSEHFPILPTALWHTSSLNIFLILCLFDLSTPTELNKGFQEKGQTRKVSSLFPMCYW